MAQSGRPTLIIKGTEPSLYALKMVGPAKGAQRNRASRAADTAATHEFSLGAKRVVKLPVQMRTMIRDLFFRQRRRNRRIDVRDKRVVVAVVFETA